MGSVTTKVVEELRATGSWRLGSHLVDVELRIQKGAAKASIFVTAPMGHWVSLGFGSKAINDTYAIIISDGDRVMERRLMSNSEDRAIRSAVLEEEHKVSIYDASRMVHVIEQSIEATSSDHFDFSSVGSSLDMVLTVGRSAQWGDSHVARLPVNVTFESLEAVSIEFTDDLNAGRQKLVGCEISKEVCDSGVQPLHRGGNYEGLCHVTRKVLPYDTPAAEECSGNGMCNGRNGICNCFAGFTGNACQRRRVLM